MRQVPRRKFLASAGALIAAPLQGFAQPAAAMPRIGFLGAANATAWAPRLDAFRAGLRDLGYVEGRNIAIEYRFAEGQYDRLPALAAELVSLKVDVIVTHATRRGPRREAGDRVESGPGGHHQRRRRRRDRHRREPRAAGREHHRRHVLRPRARGQAARSAQGCDPAGAPGGHPRESGQPGNGAATSGHGRHGQGAERGAGPVRPAGPRRTGWRLRRDGGEEGRRGRGERGRHQHHRQRQEHRRAGGQIAPPLDRLHRVRGRGWTLRLRRELSRALSPRPCSSWTRS